MWVTWSEEFVISVSTNSDDKKKLSFIIAKNERQRNLKKFKKGNKMPQKT